MKAALVVFCSVNAAAFVALVVLGARRWFLLRSYRRVEKAIALEAWRCSAHNVGSVADVEYALGRTRAVISRAKNAPLWRWTP